MFVGMGGNYSERYPGDLCNHRIRTEFKNAFGRLFFIELGTGTGTEMRIDHSIDRTRENELNGNPNRQSEFYNYKRLERQKDMPIYTKENILALVNKNFDCKFKEIIVDNYNVTQDDYISISPTN